MSLTTDIPSVTFRTLTAFNTYSEKPGELVYVNLAYVESMYRQSKYTRLSMAGGQWINVVEHPEAILP